MIAPVELDAPGAVERRTRLMRTGTKGGDVRTTQDGGIQDGSMYSEPGGTR